MITTRRRGFTMVELMIGLVLTLAIGGVTYQMLLANHRVSRTQAELVGVQDNVRSGALVIANELREVGYDVISPEATLSLGYAAVPPTRSDLIAIGPGGMTYYATRGLGFVCDFSAAAPATIVVRRDTWQSFRDARTTDSLMLYVESDNQTATDDAWVHLGIVAAPTAQNCPGAGAPAGIAFRVAPPPALDLAAAFGQVVTGGPVRLTEVMRLEYYQDGGKSWLGMRPAWVGAPLQLQPVVGPLADSTATVRGLTFTYRDANNAITAVPTNVRAIEFTLRGVTDEPIRDRVVAGAHVDTLGLTARVTLRNTLQ